LLFVWWEQYCFSFFLEVKSRIKFNSVIPMLRSPEFLLFFKIRLDVAITKEGKKVQVIKLHVSCRPGEIRSRRTDLTWDMYLSISLRREFECQFYDHSSNHCERFARVKVKYEGACATSFTVVNRVIVHAKRSASKIWMS